MLDQTFGQVYTKFKLHFYKQIFSRFEDREATLTTVESFCMEVIMALGEPTIAQFSHMMNLSTPNAAYKINSLVKKGYVERIQSTTDKREYRLRPTQKYIDYYNISYSYLHLDMERAKQRFSPDALAKLEEISCRNKIYITITKCEPLRTTWFAFCVYMIILLVTLGPFEQIDASCTGPTSQCTTDNNGNSLLFECFT